MSNGPFPGGERQVAGPAPDCPPPSSVPLTLWSQEVPKQKASEVQGREHMYEEEGLRMALNARSHDPNDTVWDAPKRAS